MSAATWSTGERVSVHLPPSSPLFDCAWFPQHGEQVTGTVERTFKNGSVAVAIDQCRNRSDDGLKTLHLDPAHLRRR